MHGDRAELCEKRHIVSWRNGHVLFPFCVKLTLMRGVDFCESPDKW